MSIMLVLFLIHLQQPYLGLQAPNQVPEMFAPGLISGPNDERMLQCSPDGRNLVYQIRGVPYSVLVFMYALPNGDWSKQTIPSFQGGYFSEFGLGPDGKTLILASRRPLSGDGPPSEKTRTYLVLRNGKSWSAPSYLGPNLDAIGHPSMTKNGNIYCFKYDGVQSHGKGDIYVSKRVNGTYERPQNLGPQVNSPMFDVDPYISPDEDYLIFVSNREPQGLYISFQKGPGTWTPARHMGKELAEGESICPFVSPDGKFLFFTSNRHNHPRFASEPLSFEAKLQALSSCQNGSNDIYWVRIDDQIERLRNEAF